MRFSSPTESGLPTEWTGALDRIQRVLADTLRALDDRIAAFDAEATTDAGPRLELPVQLITPSPDPSLPSEQQTAEIEQTLAAAQAGLEQWLTEAGQVAQKLADHAARAV
jgi:hypothetical protein